MLEQTEAAGRALSGSVDFDAVVAQISKGAAERDADPAFPQYPFKALSEAGLLDLPVPNPPGSRGRRASFGEEWRVLQAVSRADGSVGRIFDGHLNAVERVSVLAPEPLRTRELEAVASGELLLGVWGADPIPGEGPPARLVEKESGLVLEGVKTFCSGSTGLDRTLVAVRGTDGAPGPPLLAYVDLRGGGFEIDRTWFRGSGMRSSESHRVIFRGARVLAVLGEPGELVREPYFSRDAIRTATTWAGIADLALDATLEILAAKSGDRKPDEVVSLAAGRMLAAQQTMDRWLEHAAREADADPEKSLTGFSTELRATVAACCRNILDEAARVRLTCVCNRGSPGPRPARPRALSPATPSRARPGPHWAPGHNGAWSAPMRERLDREYFEDLYGQSPDPWGFETSPYERKKYERTLDVLQGRRYRRALEVGCSIGVFTAMLAPLCDELRAVDVSERAVAAARERLADFPHVQVERRRLPEETPEGPFDLVVASEVLYYWPEEVVLGALRHFEEVLTPGGVLLAVHWRKETKTYPLQGDEVHELLLEHTHLVNTTTIVEPEYRLDLFEDKE